jgi:hypothetical protein
MCEACNSRHPDEGVPKGYKVLVDPDHMCRQVFRTMVPVGDGKTAPLTEFRSFKCQVHRDHVGPHRFEVTYANRG